MIDRIRRQIRSMVAVLALAPLALMATGAANAQPALYSAGTHYTVLDTPVRTTNADRIEVIEVFWYGCNHCFRFQPLIDNWHANMADDIDFVQLPAIWNSLMQVHAQAYYTARQLGVVDSVHSAIFDAIQLRGNRLQNERQLATLFAEHAGVDEEAFSAAFNSFSVRTQVNQAERRMGAYQIRSTPNMIVNGKYLIVTSEAVRTQQDMLAVVDYLVELERNSL
jgi:thiol:disulfide interchange protein DsbA